MTAFPVAGREARSTFGVLYRLEQNERDLKIYVQSEIEPDWGRLPAGYCEVQNIACKSVGQQYASIREGTILRFRLKANPTKRLPAGCPGEKRDGPRVNLQNEKDRIAWLVRKGEAAGFKLLSLKTQPGVPDTTVSGGAGRVFGRHKNGRLTFGSVVYDGKIVVTDDEQFRRSLRKGIGSGKAYGFGLLSVAPGN